ELEAFAPHVLDQDRKLQLAAARDGETVLIDVFLDTDRDVALAFLEQPVADDAALDLVSLLAGERSVIDPEGHGECRRIDGLRRQRAPDPWIDKPVVDS